MAQWSDTQKKKKLLLMDSAQSLEAMCDRICRISYIRKDYDVDLKTHSRTALLLTTAIEFT